MIAVLTTREREDAESFRDWLLYEEWIEARIGRAKRPLSYKVGRMLYTVNVQTADAAAARRAREEWKENA